MHDISTVKRLEDSALYKKLITFSSSADRTLSGNIIEVCKEAAQQTKLIFTNFPQYTLHDGDHLLRVTEIIALIAGTTINSLNSVEISILILAAHFHDIGMAPSHEELEIYLASDDFLYFRETWIANHPNYTELTSSLSGGKLSSVGLTRARISLDEMDQAIITGYLRQIHAEKGIDNFEKKYAQDKRLDFAGINIAPYVAKICKSHAIDANQITPTNGFNYDEAIGHLKINMAYLAVLLRLGDITDFDRERTPDVLYNSIHFTSPVSIQEWEKHRAVVGWTIESNIIRYSMQFDHPVYENIARNFLNVIDQELQHCHSICNAFPASFQQYKLEIPPVTDKSRIGPKNKSYISFDLSFSLSRNEIVNLLLTHNLYKSPSVCIRELLQNSADAIRLRGAQFVEAGTHWTEGKINFEHYVDEEGIEILKCTDNGCGMDESIIRNYFTKVGKSYYQSPEFLQKRIHLRKYNADFDPCSQFGIGFMSCFMIGDKIEIFTKRDFGPGISYGKPIEVEINGTGGIITIREGKDSQPIGTTILIHSRKKPDFYDVWTDKIRLAILLKGYALAVEYPIHISTKIPEIATEYTINKDVELFPSLVEKQRILSRKNHKISFKDIDNDLGGFIEESFMVDDQGRYCLENSEAAWTPSVIVANRRQFILSNKLAKNSTELSERHMTVCMDGILITGVPGRPTYGQSVRHMLGWRNPFIDSHASCCIDIRGGLKPEITPARTPPERSGFDDLSPKWQRIQDIIYKANGQIWDIVSAESHAAQLEPECIWKLGKLYSFLFTSLSYSSILNFIPLPFRIGNELTWRYLRDIPRLLVGEESEHLNNPSDNARLLFPEVLLEWEASGSDQSNLRHKLTSLVISVCDLSFDGLQYQLSPEVNSDNSQRPFEYIYFRRLSVPCFALNYSGDLNKYVSADTPFASINRRHPLYDILFRSKYISTKNSLQEFAHSFLTGISNVRARIKGNQPLHDRWKKFIGCKYKSINWGDIDQKHQPPYFVKTGPTSEDCYSDEIFQEWSQITLRNEFFDDPLED